jgi:hypothetical protein
MHIILYSRSEDEISSRVRQTVESLFSRKRVDMCRNIGELSLRLCQPVDNALVAVLLVRDRADLEDIFSVQFLLRDIRSVLVLPDREMESYAKKRLQPRFITYMESEYLIVEIAAVLRSMLEIIFLHKRDRVTRWQGRVHSWLSDRKMYIH